MADISYKAPTRVLTPTGGFLNGYSHSLNPYIGCVYACSYCYVRQMPVALFRGESWGSWVQVKADSSTRLRTELQRAKRKGPVSIFMSSSTDPYQPIEHKAEVTRSFLEVMVDEPPDFLFVQTRSPLVVRDIDLFLPLADRILISMTLETDLEPIRKAFTPTAPPIEARWRAMQTLADSQIPLQAALAPVLPFSDDFPTRLATIVNRVCVDDYTGDGRGGKRTDRLPIKAIYEQLGLTAWYDANARLMACERLQTDFSPAQVRVGQNGFLPPVHIPSNELHVPAF